MSIACAAPLCFFIAYWLEAHLSPRPHTHSHVHSGGKASRRGVATSACEAGRLSSISAFCPYAGWSLEPKRKAQGQAGGLKPSPAVAQNPASAHSTGCGLCDQISIRGCRVMLVISESVMVVCFWVFFVKKTSALISFFHVSCFYWGEIPVTYNSPF